MKKFFTLVLVLSQCSGLALAGDVYRWTDDKGKKHFGDQVPDKYRASSRLVDMSNVELTPAQRHEAQQRAAQDRAAARLTTNKAGPRDGVPTPGTSSPALPAKAVSSGETPCDLEWKKYSASSECFAPYMLAGGGIKAEAFSVCTEAKTPVCGPQPAQPATSRSGNN